MNKAMYMGLIWPQNSWKQQIDCSIGTWKSFSVRLRKSMLLSTRWGYNFSLNNLMLDTLRSDFFSGIHRRPEFYWQWVYWRNCIQLCSKCEYYLIYYTLLACTSKRLLKKCSKNRNIFLVHLNKWNFFDLCSASRRRCNHFCSKLEFWAEIFCGQSFYAKNQLYGCGKPFFAQKWDKTAKRLQSEYCMLLAKNLKLVKFYEFWGIQILYKPFIVDSIHF